MGMSIVCPGCGYTEPGSNQRGAHIGSCPDCGTQMRAHTAGKAQGRYVCPITTKICTLGLGATVQLNEPMRLAFIPGQDIRGYEPDPEQAGRERPVSYLREQPESYEQEALDRAAGRVFGPGCVIDGRFRPRANGERRAGVYLVPAPEADPAMWFVNEPVVYKKCAACTRRVPATDTHRADREWTPARESFWQGSGWSRRRIEISQGPHRAGTYACPDCRPGPATATASGTDLPEVIAEAGSANEAESVPGDHARETASAPQQRREHPRPDSSYVRCEGAGARVVLAFPYDVAMVSRAKAIGGRHFDWSTKTNVYPFLRLPQVVEFADEHGIDVPQEVRVLVSVAAQQVRRQPGGDRARLVRDTARLYLGYGLLPVPGWAVREDGICRCRRGSACPRPGKHPRSVYVGPGRYDYSWRPLTCSTHEDIELRFASGGKYAIANLMLAIPAGILVIDQDFDDGGRQALATLADQLGELPATLSHATPHGTHLIFRTPPGWTTRAWVGKDARNPLPAGIDLRVPGQILMAPPSQVPDADALTAYGPVTESVVAELPAAYLDSWTPPRQSIRPSQPPAIGPPGRAEPAASYVNARITGIAKDLANLKPGGRNTAIYTAALKVGSTLGAIRATPAAEHAATAWTDKAAEEALMAAANENGYVADHSAAAAWSAIRSGLRNGLHNPRPLPDCGAGQSVSTRRGGAVTHDPDTAGVRRPPLVSRQDEPPVSLGDDCDAPGQEEAGEWQARFTALHSDRAIATQALGPEIGQ